ncbi:MAG: AMP-binding protein [Syntrophomonadales bacterium]|jgi:long-chain acyl-CoA synthetase
MERPWYKWYDKLGIPHKFQYPDGKIPAHEMLRRNALRYGDKPGTIFFGTEISFKEMDKMSDQVANYLLSKGVKRGDRVGIYMYNCPEHIAVHFGILKAGAIVCPLNVLFKEMELRYQINDAGMVGILMSDALYPAIKKIRPEIPTVKFLAYSNFNDFLPEEPVAPIPPIYTTPRYISADEDIDDLYEVFKNGDAKPYRYLDWDMDEVCMLEYTSGTSGMPKGAMLSHMAHVYKPFAAYYAWGFRDFDVVVTAMPFYHIAGMDSMLSTWLIGSTAILLPTPDPVGLMTVIEKYKVTGFYSLAPINHAIADHPDVGKYDLSSLQVCTSSSFVLPVNEELSEKFRKATGCPVWESSFGLTETHTLDTMMPFNMVKWGAQGIPIPENDIIITDPQDPKKILPYGEQGEILIKGPGTFLGYWNKPEATEEALVDGYVRTGDMGMIDEDGYLFWYGRFKEMIKVSGVSVFPEAVESMLSFHEAVAESAVIGVPDARRGEVVKAFVVLREGFKGKVTEEELIKWSLDNMSPHNAPRYIEFRDALPKSGTNKLLRRELRDEEAKKRGE